MSGEGVRVRRATIKELGAAGELLAEYYEAIGVVKRDSLEEIAGYLSGEAGSRLWMASLDGLAAGCVVLRPLDGMERAAECKRLYVRLAFRGRGIADALLDAMEEHARAAGVAWVYLDSMEEMRAALQIYTRRGYEACARYNENPQATVFLRKQL